jgi:hypothetical protein
MPDDPAPLTPTATARVAAIRERHQPDSWWTDCTACRKHRTGPCEVQALLAALAAAEQAYDDCHTSTHEMLGELLTEHQIAPEPCPGGPCVASALTAISARLTRLAALEQAARAYLDRNKFHDVEIEMAVLALDAAAAGAAGASDAD